MLGSTGSIGTQALDIIEEYSDRFSARVLTARNNWELLALQARKFLPAKVVISEKKHFESLKEALKDLPIEVAAGSNAIADAVEDPQIDIVLTALVGYSGLAPTIRAIEHNKVIALANKETLVAGGEIIRNKLAASKSEILPVDSEHSAIFQCLQGERTVEARKIILTASGGPFRTFSLRQLENVTAGDALKHPNWDMGAKVTIDSASMMNKGFEMIEARWLFDCPPERIEIVVHPQSIVHSMVEFNDGSIKAQLGVPDMHLPIRYALGYPERLATEAPELKLSQYSKLTFEAPDYERFPLLGYAFEAIGRGGNMPCILNAANEIAVDAFLKGRIRFTDMPRLARATMDSSDFEKNIDYNIIVESNAEARKRAAELLNSL